MKTLVNRLNLSDLFAVIVPGFYTLIVFYVVYSTNKTLINPSSDSEKVKNFWDILDGLSLIIYEKPSSLLFILFSAYLIGSVFRAIPVRWTERLIPPFTCKFPYPTMLKNVLNTLKRKEKSIKQNISNLPNLSKGLPKDVYNYWKYLICMRAPEAFQLYQTFENRSRFFAGMILSGLAGTLVGCLMFLVDNIQYQINTPLTILSATILVVFGSNFRRIRLQETRALFLMYIGYLQETNHTIDNSNTELQEKMDNK